MDVGPTSCDTTHTELRIITHEGRNCNRNVKRVSGGGGGGGGGDRGDIVKECRKVKHKLILHVGATTKPPKISAIFFGDGGGGGGGGQESRDFYTLRHFSLRLHLYI